MDGIGLGQSPPAPWGACLKGPSALAAALHLPTPVHANMHPPYCLPPRGLPPPPTQGLHKVAVCCDPQGRQHVPPPPPAATWLPPALERVRGPCCLPWDKAESSVVRVGAEGLLPGAANCACTPWARARAGAPVRGCPPALEFSPASTTFCVLVPPNIEKTFDFPCRGSHFDQHGKVIQHAFGRVGGE